MTTNASSTNSQSQQQTQPLLTNNSGINPKGNKLLVKPDEVDKKTATGIIIADVAVEKEEMAQMYGTCVAVGDFCWVGAEPWCKVGDKIVFAKYADQTFKGHDGIMYRLIRDKEVIATVDQAKEKDQSNA